MRWIINRLKWTVLGYVVVAIVSAIGGAGIMATVQQFGDQGLQTTQTIAKTPAGQTVKMGQSQFLVAEQNGKKVLEEVKEAQTNPQSWIQKIFKALWPMLLAIAPIALLLIILTDQ